MISQLLWGELAGEELVQAETVCGDRFPGLGGIRIIRWLASIKWSWHLWLILYDNMWVQFTRGFLSCRYSMRRPQWMSSSFNPDLESQNLSHIKQPIMHTSSTTIDCDDAGGLHKTSLFLWNHFFQQYKWSLQTRVAIVHLDRVSYFLEMIVIYGKCQNQWRKRRVGNCTILQHPITLIPAGHEIKAWTFTHRETT